MKFSGSQAYQKCLLVHKFECATNFKNKEFAMQGLEIHDWDLHRAIEGFKRFPKDKLPKNHNENKAKVAADTGNIPS